MTEVRRICFVCLGNIVRSPLAENLFRNQTAAAGVEHLYEIDSAGTGNWHVGEPPDRRMRRVAAEYGLNYDGRARQFKYHDLEYFDLIIAMDVENYSDLRMLSNKTEHQEKLHLLREFDPRSTSNLSVPDPYYDGKNAFHEVYKIVERSVSGLFSYLEADRTGIEIAD